MKTDGQLMLSIGALLASEREKRGIPVERAAKETRMRPQRIRDMEADDLSHFSNPSYARMFLIAYAKYLGIPMRTINEHLPDRGEPGTEGYQYISTSNENLPAIRSRLTTSRKRRNPVFLMLTTAAVAVTIACAVGALILLGMNISRLPRGDEASQAAADNPTPAPAQVVVIQYQDHLDNFVPTNVTPDGTAASDAFDGEVQIAQPPTPQPGLMTVRRSFTPALSATTAPASAEPRPTPDSVISADQAFLLSTSPDFKPANVQ